MSTITLKQADTIIDAIIARGAELNCRPISAIVVEPGCKVKAFKKEDGASMIRFEMAFGKAYAALSLGRSSSLVHQRADPHFLRRARHRAEEHARHRHHIERRLMMFGKLQRVDTGSFRRFDKL